MDIALDRPDENERPGSASTEGAERLRVFLENFAGIAYQAAGETFRASLLYGRVEEITGYPADDFTSGRVRWIDLILQEDREALVTAERRLVEEPGDVADLEYRIRRKDGAIRWMHDVVRRLPSGEAPVPMIQGAIHDVTERRETEEALRRALSLLEATLDSTADALLVVGTDGKFSRHNRRFTEMWRLPREVIESGDDEKALAFVLDQLRDPEAFLAKVRELYATPASSSFDVIEFRDGRIIERYSIPQRLGGKIVGRVWSFRDVTARRRAEEERRRLEAQVQHAQKLESLGVLAGGIAHDFNNILTAILGNADLALSLLSDVAPARGMVEEIERASRQAADLCRQMLAYSGRGRFVVKPIDLSKVVEEMAHLVRVSISKGAALRLSLASDLPPVAADATQVRQVVMNLIVNASEAIGGGSGVIRVTTGTMACDRAYLSGLRIDDDLPAGRYVFLEVTDTGCGMDADTVARIFDPFFTTKFTGRGLGLAAVQGIVRGHHGAIKVYSERDRGTTFKVLFPAVDGLAEPNGTATDAETLRGGEGTVLLVDDEESVRKIGKRMIDSAGFTTLTAQDGVEALEIVQRHGEQVLCVVLDLTMPRLGGEETFRELRRLRPDLPVILSSGYDEMEVTQRFAGKGLSGFVQKPYRVAALLGEIRRVTRK